MSLSLSLFSAYLRLCLVHLSYPRCLLLLLYVLILSFSILVSFCQCVKAGIEDALTQMSDQIA